MPNELIVAFENQLEPLMPHFEQVLAGFMPVERLMRTAVISAEKNPYLLECDRQSFFNTIMTAAVLGLEMDGVTGQCFPIPFKKKIQLVIGYKGYNTLGARAGLTITGDVVRDGDDFDWEKGTKPFVKHKAAKKRGNITHAWAIAAANNRPPVIEVLDIDEILDIKKRSPGARKDDSPWNDPTIGFAAMASKSAKRRLCRSTPLNIMQLAARMEEAYEEQGLHSFITPGRELVMDGRVADAEPERQINDTPEAETLMEPSKVADPLQALKAEGDVAAKEGMDGLRIWYGDLPKNLKKQIKPYLDSTLKAEAEKADKAARFVEEQKTEEGALEF